MSYVTDGAGAVGVMVHAPRAWYQSPVLAGRLVRRTPILISEQKYPILSVGDRPLPPRQSMRQKHGLGAKSALTPAGDLPHVV